MTKEIDALIEAVEKVRGNGRVLAGLLSHNTAERLDTTRGKETIRNVIGRWNKAGKGLDTALAAAKAQHPERVCGGCFHFSTLPGNPNFGKCYKERQPLGMAGLLIPSDFGCNHWKEATQSGAGEGESDANRD